MLNREINSIIKKYGCKAYIVYSSFRKPINIIFSSLSAKNTAPQMEACGLVSSSYYTGIISTTEPQIADGDTICINDRLFSVVSTVMHENNGNGLYRKVLLLEKGDLE